ncbi:MAG: hypothetical protein JOZ69_04560 [Myxococcales bacterium]|nr:hypothetical protein [Myxococcales bacterium]
MAFSKPPRPPSSLFSRSPRSPASPSVSPGVRGARPSAAVTASALLRIFVFAALVIGASTWALVRHYAWRSPPMLVPASPAPAPTYDADAGEFPVPEDFELVSPGSRDGG